MLPIVLDRKSNIPVSTQIVTAVRDFVAIGSLKAGEAVPSTRYLASQLGVARGTVVAAFDQLVAESYLVATPGGKTIVHEDAGTLVHAVPRSEKRNKARQQSHQLKGNQTRHSVGNAANRRASKLLGQVDARTIEIDSDVTKIDLRPRSKRAVEATDSAWREAWRKAAQYEQLSAQDSVQGLYRLRVAIAEHLRLMRSMVVEPEDIFITTGAREGLFQVLNAIGPSPLVGVEAPGYAGLKRVIERTPARSVDLNVDSDGVVVSSISNVDAVLATPNHLYPAGGSMPAPRRHELLAAAARDGFLVIEDDIDSEYRHVGPVMPSLWELAPSVVAHLGTFALVMTSDARIGYVVAPTRLHAELIAVRNELGAAPSPIAQRAVASYLENGGLRRQITKRRRELLRRKELVNSILGAEVVQHNAGAMAVIATDSADLASRIVENCASHGVVVDELRQYWGSDSAGIALGYGEVTSHELDLALRHVRDAFTQLAGGK